MNLDDLERAAKEAPLSIPPTSYHEPTDRFYTLARTAVPLLVEVVKEVQNVDRNLTSRHELPLGWLAVRAALSRLGEA